MLGWLIKTTRSQSLGKDMKAGSSEQNRKGRGEEKGQMRWRPGRDKMEGGDEDGADPHCLDKPQVARDFIDRQ